MTAGAGHTAGHTEGRRRASGARTQKAGRNKPRGRGDGRGHDGTQQETHSRQEERRTSGGKARKGGGERDTDGRKTHGSRTGTEREQRKRVCNIFKGEKRGENTAETRKSVQVCAYTYYPISRRGGYLLHFLLYILRGYIVYI